MKYVFMCVAALIPGLSFAAPFADPIGKYQAGGIVEILIVPGHDDRYSGAVFKGQREADMALVLANKLAAELRSDPNVFVTVARDENGYYPPLAEYLTENETEIRDFIADNKKETEKLIDRGRIAVPQGVTHNDAPGDVAYTLYGINKWAAEESFDFVLHVHFNDDASHMGFLPGAFSGYTIYIPDQNLPNAEVTKPFADSIGREMGKTFFPSNLPLEQSRADEYGSVPDFKLIALGSNRTLEVPSLLMEYSYIYEPHVAPEFLELSTGVMARATARGIFNLLSGPQEWNSLSYHWTKAIAPSIKKDPDVLALQFALRELGYFPPATRDRTNCPFTGIFGPCTQKALKEFQKDHGLVVDGVAGKKTFAILNAEFAY